MLAKKNRLNLADPAARSIFKEANKKFSEHFIFFYRKNSKEFKATVVIPKQKVKLAVKRNQLKRKVYQIIQESVLTELTLEIVILLKKTDKFGFDDLKKEISPVINEIKHL